MNDFFSFSRLHLLEKEKKSFFIKDPIHHEINFFKDQLWLYELVNTFEFQRLDRIRQLSLTCYNFPSGVHTRLSHCLGVYELCNRFIKHFLDIGDLDATKDAVQINIALASALLHDLGHGPMSHVFEKSFPLFDHEEMSCRIILSPETKVNFILSKKSLADGLPESFYAEEICKVLRKESEHKWIIDLITSHIDIDRLDFLLRDSYYSGVSYGNIDVGIFIKWSVLRRDKEGNLRFFFKKKAKYLVEHFLLSRHHMYEELYLNRVSAVYEDLFVKIVEFIRFSLDRFSKKPAFKVIAFLFQDPKDWKICEFTSLYDFMFIDVLRDLLAGEEGEAKELYSYFFGHMNDTSTSEYMDKHEFNLYEQHCSELTVSFWDEKKKEPITASLKVSNFWG